MNILRGCGRSLRGKSVEWEGIEPSTSGLKVPCGPLVSLDNYRVSPLRRAPRNVEKYPRIRLSLRGARLLARHGLYHILQVTDPRRGRLELRYVRGWPEALTVQLSLFN